MKKILLLSITTLAMLMADITLIGEQLVFPQSAGENGSTPIETPLSPNNKYLEPVEIPEYNPNDSTHVLITTTNGMWKESVINNLSYKHFYIEPGTYTSSDLEITSSGKDTDRRTLSLYDPSNPIDVTHPASLPDNKQANVKIKFNRANYRTIDRLSTLEYNNKIMTFYTSTHNIINKLHARNMYKGIYIYAGCSFNTIQNSYIDTATHAGRLSDALGVGLMHVGVANAETLGTKIINNDIKNLGDGIQLVRTFGSTNTIDFGGTIIDSNRVWVDSNIYTDGAGNYTPTGEYCVAENAIDVKAGTFDINNPILITNNKCWGYRHSDTSLMNNVPGKPINISFADAQNIKYENNVVFDSEWGMFLTNLSGPASSIKNNIIYDIGHITPTNKDVWVLSTPSSTGADTTGVEISNNSIISTGVSSTTGGRAMYVNTNTHGLMMNNNLFIDTINIQGDLAKQNRDNTFYYNHSGGKIGGSKEQDMATADPKMGNYTFEYERYTSNPETKTLEGVISTSNSPHYQKAGSSIGN